MKWLKRVLIVLVALAGVAALVPFFVSAEDYLPAIEKELSTRLERPVSIDSLRASLFPLPHAVLDGITIGNSDDIKVRKVTLKPDLWSLFGSSKVIRSIDFEEPVLSYEALSGLLALTGENRGAGAVRIEAVRLRGAVVKLERGTFGPFDADVQVSSASQQGEVTLRTQDDVLKARVIPVGGEPGLYALELSAKGWTPPMGPAIRFDELNLKGSVTLAGAELADINAKLYGGTLAGQIAVGWEKGVSVKGELTLKQVGLKELLALASPNPRLSGRLDARPRFSASAAEASQLDEALRVETPFTVHAGVLHGFDLTDPATLVLKQGGGGQTRFDALAGQLVMERRHYRFSQLKIAAGALSARGHVTVAPSKALSGQLTTSLKAGGAAAAVPVVVAGTLDSPMLLPNTTALLGAAAGSAVLGPGLGTAAGAKLGEFAEGLLGRKKR
jgi:uncharacterized protein involved in outer membrane biogenesis